MVTREEAFRMVLQAEAIMKELTSEAERNHDVLIAVYTYLKITQHANEWSKKLGELHQRDWTEWCKTHEADGRTFINWWNNGEPQEGEHR